MDALYQLSYSPVTPADCDVKNLIGPTGRGVELTGVEPVALFGFNPPVRGVIPSHH